MFPGDQKPPFSIELAEDGSAGLVVQQDSQAELPRVKLMRGVDESGANFTAESSTSPENSLYRSTPAPLSLVVSHVVAKRRDRARHGQAQYRARVPRGRGAGRS